MPGPFLLPGGPDPHIQNRISKTSQSGVVVTRRLGHAATALGRKPVATGCRGVTRSSHIQEIAGPSPCLGNHTLVAK